MPHLENITKIHVCWKLYQNGISAEVIPSQIGVHRATVYRWLKWIKIKGINKFIRDYKLAKTGRRRRNKTMPEIQSYVFEIRRKYRNCCGEKIRYFLQKEYNCDLAVSTIYRILAKKYRLRSKWKKNEKRGPVLRGSKPREVIQVDTVDFGGVYAFTAIDTFTREAHVVLSPKLDSNWGKKALLAHKEFFKEINGLQRDGGPEFKDKWQEQAQKFTTKIRTAKPYKKNEQAFIERFNGILRKECLGYTKFSKNNIWYMQQKLDEFLDYYHTIRPHLSLNMQTPHNFAMSHLT